MYHRVYLHVRIQIGWSDSSVHKWDGGLFLCLKTDTDHLICEQTLASTHGTEVCLCLSVSLCASVPPRLSATVGGPFLVCTSVLHQADSSVHEWDGTLQLWTGQRAIGEQSLFVRFSLWF